MCSSPEGYGSISTTYVLRVARARAGLGVRDVERALVLPDALPLLLDRLWARTAPSSSVSGYKKASRARGPGKLSRRRRGCFLLYGRSCFTARMRSRLIPGARHARSRRAVERELDGGVPATELAERFGTPLVVYCEADAPRAGARCSGGAAPDALVVYGTKAFPNVALMRLLAEEGLGADVSSLGELAFARAAGIDGERADRAREQQVGRRAARRGRGGRARRARRARRAGARGRGRRPRACSSASRPASRPTRTRRSAPATAARSSASTRTRRSSRSTPRARWARGRRAARARGLPAR